VIPLPINASRCALALCLSVLAGCANASEANQAPVVKADQILVDKSDRTLILYRDGKEIHRYTGIRFGDQPVGHKQFEGDEKTPEGRYTINGRNPKSAYHLSLRISYPNAADSAFAKSKGKSPGGDIFIHGQPNGWDGPAIPRDWTDGCIALSNAEIRLLWKQVDDGTEIIIQP
jgi:murein L,D-transpeptidase YafK